HFGPDGKSPWAWMHEAGYIFDYAGENLAVNFVDSKDVVAAWMHSSSHRDNVLSREFTEIGIGIAEGVYQGRKTVFVVEMFGRPSFAKASADAEPARPAGGALADKSAGKPALVTDVFPPVEARIVPSKSEQGGGAAAEETASSSEEISPVASSSFLAFSKAPPRESGGERAPGFYTLLFGRIFSNPGRIANLFYLALMMVVALAMLLNIFVKMRIQHPRLIVNGVMMLLALSSIILLNQYIALAAEKIL
ncbi:MAG: CAP domain-containing protein, partial [Patescibacteria group bacterium]